MTEPSEPLEDVAPPADPPAPAADKPMDGAAAATWWGYVGFAIVMASMLVGFALMIAAGLYVYREYLRK